MKKSQLGYLFAALLLSFTACSNQTENDNENSGNDSTLVIPVEAGVVNRGDISAYYSNTTTLEAEQEARVVAKVRGVITKLLVEEGDWVKAGQKLAQIDDAQYRLEAERAKSTLDRLNNDFKRNKELFERKLIAADAYENSRYEYEAQKSVYELAQLTLEYTQIKSPISGVISERLIKVGNMIGTDQPAFQVTDFDPLQAIIYIPEHEMAKIRKNQTAELIVDALPNQTFKGHVERISPVVDATTGTFKATVYVDQKNTILKPGMFGRIKIVYDTRLNAQLIPKAAVITEDQTQSVFVIKDSLVYKREVKTGYVNGKNIEIIDGLTDGDIVVTIGQGSLQDSVKVIVVKS